MQVCGLMEDGELYTLLDDEDPYVRGWSVQFYGEQGNDVPSRVAKKFVELSAADESPVVRRYLA